MQIAYAYHRGITAVPFFSSDPLRPIRFCCSLPGERRRRQKQHGEDIYYATGARGLFRGCRVEGLLRSQVGENAASARAALPGAISYSFPAVAGSGLLLDTRIAGLGTGRA